MDTDLTNNVVAIAAIVLVSCAVGALTTTLLQIVFEVHRQKKKPKKHVNANAILESLADAFPQSAASAEQAQAAIARAGIKMAPSTLWALRLASAALFMVCGLILGIKSGNILATVAAPALGAVIGAVLPQLMLMSKRRQWQDNIDRELPNALDLMCVSMQAGSTFGSAVRTVARRTQGDLADALSDVVAAAEFEPVTSALKRFSDNAGVSSLTMFVASIIQAEESGMALGDVLTTQAESVRAQRRLAMEEEINKLPVKMTLPCMIIFAAMLIIVLGPPVSQVASLAGVLG